MFQVLQYFNIYLYTGMQIHKVDIGNTIPFLARRAKLGLTHSYLAILLQSCPHIWYPTNQLFYIIEMSS